MKTACFDVEGVKTSFLGEGTGQSITLIHGAMCNHRLWNKQIKDLSHIGEVHALDLPGHGESARFPPNQQLSIKLYADHVHRFVKASGYSSTVLIGHSMGGAISIQYAWEHPKEVKALILVGTGAKLGVSPAIFEALSADYERSIRVDMAKLSFSNKTDKHIVDEGIKEMLKCAQDISIADFRACNSFDARSFLPEIEAPTLIIVGKEDKLTPVKWSEYLHKNIENSKMEVVNDAGHLVMVEKPLEVSTGILTFLEEAFLQESGTEESMRVTPS